SRGRESALVAHEVVRRGAGWQFRVDPSFDRLSSIAEATLEVEDASDCGAGDPVASELGRGGEDLDVAARVAALVARGARARFERGTVQPPDRLRVDAEQV